jgi:hypothetical protein
MPITPLQKLINTKLADGKIDPDDAREILGKVERDGKYDDREIAELQKLAAMPRKTFVSKDEFIPNPMDIDDGVTIKAEPQKWIKHAVALATATLEVKSTIPGLTVELGKAKRFHNEEFEDFGSGDYMARKLTLTMKGGTIEKDGKVEFKYGSKTVSVPVTKGMSSGKVYNQILSQLYKQQGSLTSTGTFDPKKTTAQKVGFEITNL